MAHRSHFRHLRLCGHLSVGIGGRSGGLLGPGRRSVESRGGSAVLLPQVGVIVGLDMVQHAVAKVLQPLESDGTDDRDAPR